MTELELNQAIAELQAECKAKDRRLVDLEYIVKDLQYQLDRANSQLQLKNAWDKYDIDGRC
jgi:D-alanyl-D-alanine dipeptidase